jgi:hypothetical protein
MDSSSCGECRRQPASSRRSGQHCGVLHRSSSSKHLIPTAIIRWQSHVGLMQQMSINNQQSGNNNTVMMNNQQQQQPNNMMNMNYQQQQQQPMNKPASNKCINSK